MNRPRVLITGPRMLRDFEALRPRFDTLPITPILADVEQCLTEDQLIPLVGDIEGCICGGDKWTARVFDAAPNLRALCKWGTGVDAIDLEAAASRGIAVRNCPDAFSVPVADTVFAFMLGFARRLPQLDRAIKAGGWERIDGVSLAECTLGVVGVGNIGQAVIRRARAFGMRILATDPREPSPQFLDDTGARMTSLETVLREADFLTLHCDLNPTTRRLIGVQEFALMKPSAYLINTSRGPVVDEKALIRALQESRLAGAGLDVFETEPPARDNPLRFMDNVLLTPHLANSSHRAAWKTHERAMQNLMDLLAATPPRGRGRSTLAPAAPDGRLVCVA